MFYSDEDILDARQNGWLDIQPFDLRNLGGGSYDVHLDPRILVFNDERQQSLDPCVDNSARFRSHVIADRFRLRSGEFIIGAISERVTVGPRVVPSLHGKSSLGRLALTVHQTAGLGDPGWDGMLTLEIVNQLPCAIWLYPGMPIAQLVFAELKTPATRLYHGKYAGDTGPQASLYHLNWDEEKKAWR